MWQDPVNESLQLLQHDACNQNVQSLQRDQSVFQAVTGGLGQALQAQSSCSLACILIVPPQRSKNAFQLNLIHCCHSAAGSLASLSFPRNAHTAGRTQQGRVDMPTSNERPIESSHAEIDTDLLQ